MMFTLYCALVLYVFRIVMFFGTLGRQMLTYLHTQTFTACGVGRCHNQFGACLVYYNGRMELH